MPGYGNYGTPFTNRRSTRLVDLQSRPYRPSKIRLQSTSPGWKVPSAHNKLHLGGKESFSSYPFEQGIFHGFSNVESICRSMERAIFFADPWLTFFPNLQLCTDAANATQFGGIFSGNCFQGRWPPHLLINKTKGSVLNSCLRTCYLHIFVPTQTPFRKRLLLKKILREILRHLGSPRIRNQPVTPGVLLTISPILVVG